MPSMARQATAWLSTNTNPTATRRRTQDKPRRTFAMPGCSTSRTPVCIWHSIEYMILERGVGFLEIHFSGTVQSTHIYWGLTVQSGSIAQRSIWRGDPKICALMEEAI